jgi:hypothetical protein
MHCADIVVHIDETLDDDHIHNLEKVLGNKPGVYCACVHEARRHLMLVDFDPESIRPSQIVHTVRYTGLHAEMIGF